MKNNRCFIFLLILALFPILCSCTQAQAKLPETSLLQVFDFSNDTVEVKGIQANTSIDELLQAISLTREDCEILESKAVAGNIIVDPMPEIYYEEFGSHEVDVIYIFTDDELKQISYNVAFWDTEFDEAYKIAADAFRTIESNMPFAGKLNCEGFIMDANTESSDLLNEFKAGIPGTRVVEIWDLDGMRVYLDIVYQDRSAAAYRPDDVICMQMNIFYQT